MSLGQNNVTGIGHFLMFQGSVLAVGESGSGSRNRACNSFYSFWCKDYGYLQFCDGESNSLYNAVFFFVTKMEL